MRNWFVAVMIGMIVTAVYLPVQALWFFEDDFSWLLTGLESLQTPGQIMTHRIFNYYRPTTTFSFALEASLYGNSATGHHLFNLAVHLLNTLLTMTILQKIFRRTIPVIAGTLWFGLTGVSSEAVLWISSRTDLLSLFFSLGSIAVAIRRPSKLKSASLALHLLLLSAAIFAKEAALIMVVALLLIDGMHCEKNSKIPGWRSWIKDWMQRRFPTLATTLVFLIVHLSIQLSGGIFLTTFNFPLIGLTFVSNALGGTAYHILGWAPWIFTRFDGTGLLCFLALLILSRAVARHGNSNLLSSLLITVFLMVPASIAPFRFLPAPWLTFERFFYAAGFGAALFIASLADSVMKRRGRCGWVILAAAFAFALFMNVSHAADKIQEWKSLTQARRSLMESVRAELSKIQADRKIKIWVAKESFDREMFLLFAGRDVDIIHEAPFAREEGVQIYKYDRGSFEGPL